MRARVAEMAGETLFDKLWAAHVVRDLGDDWALLHVDRHLMHDLGGGPAFAELARQGLECTTPSSRLRRRTTPWPARRAA